MSVDLGWDPSAAYYGAGYIDGIASSITTIYIDDAMQYATTHLGGLFERAMDTAARFAPERYNHVYEWGETYGSRETVGVPEYRLWRLKYGGGRGRRTVGFEFLPSHRPSPIEPQLLEPGKKGRVVNEGVHIFTWKAPIMEYGLPVTIMPQLAKKLAFVDPQTGKLVFTSRTITDVPGKDKLEGNFTTFYTAWWTEEAPRLFESQIKPRLEFDIVHPRGTGGRFVTRGYAVPSKSTEARVGVQSYAAGRRSAEADMEKNRMDYIGRAAERRAELYGY
jgi:hypothetical protein